ncbi:MAG: DUF927 domain-containing protein [Ruminococcus sp.]|nr:DUF927 domain-containing protein [Ruminococcus sp.]
MLLALHKPTNIPKLTDITTGADASQELDGIGAFGRKAVSKNTLQHLAQSELTYPVIPVERDCLLLAVNSKNFQGLVWLSSWFEVVSAYRDKNSVYHVRLRINDEPVEVDYDALHPKDISRLTKFGLLMDIKYADELSKYLFRRIANLKAEEQVSGMGFMVNDEKLTFRGYDEDPQILYYTDTSLTEYIGGLNKLLTNPAIMFALCCSCASLFLAFLGIACDLPLMSFIVSFYGKSTTGKSTAQTLMASVFTDPKNKKIYIPFFGTLNAIIKNLASKFGVPQLFDEATVASGINMESLLYTITLEQDKSRCNSSAALRTPDTWKLIAITSSESKLLSDRQMHNKGLDVRVLNFELGFTDNRKHSDEIHNFCGKNYGVLGKALSEQLLSADHNVMIQQYDECKETMRNAIDDAATFDLAERLINEYAVILLAGQELSKLGVSIDIEGITALMADNCSTICETTDIAGKYYHHLVNYAVLHPYAEGIKKDEQTCSVAFIDELFLKVLSDYGASDPDLVIKELDTAGYLFRRKKNALKNRLRFGGVLVSCYEILLSKDDADSDDGCMTLEYILTHFEGIDES